MSKSKYDEILDQIGENLVFVPYHEWSDDDFKDPTQYYVKNAMDENVYFRTRSRAKAQEWSDMLYGKNFYIVKKAMKAAVR